MVRLRTLRWAPLLAPLLLSAAEPGVVVGAFSEGRLTGWQPERFQGETEYRISRVDGRQALRAESDGTASGLYREKSVDLTETPLLHWRWRVENTLGALDERSKGGDDYPARVYVVFSGGIFFWRTRAINYVWSNHQPVGSTWENAFTGNARMIAVRSGPEETGRWLEQSRDVRADYRRLFGEDVTQADAVAIMTDTDNAGGRAVAYYGDIWFSGK